MKDKRRLLLVASVITVLALPAGFAAAQAIRGDQGESGSQVSETPEQVDYLAEQKAIAEEAYASGDDAALDRAASAIRDVQVSLMDAEERKAYEEASSQEAVPPGTLAFLPESMPASSVETCRDELKERGSEPLCELIVLHDEGKIRSGAFSPEQVADALGTDSTPAEEGGR